MRLRDRPKTLADMKGDVDWPPRLQTVMDRGLARAPAERYPTAPEFAFALAEAAGIEFSRRPTPSAPARAATRVEGAAPVPRATPERKGSRVAIVGGAAVFAVVALASVAVFALRGRAANSATDSQPPAASGAPVTSSGVTGADSVTSVDSRSPRTGAGSPGVRTLGAASKPGAPAAPPGAGASAAAAPVPRADTPTPSVGSVPRPLAPVNPARASLDYVESLIVRARSDTTRSAAFARDVLDSARVIVPRLEARQDIVELGVYTVAAYLLLGRKTDACLMLESIGAEAGEMKKFAAQVQLWNDRLDCRG